MVGPHRAWLQPANTTPAEARCQVRPSGTNPRTDHAREHNIYTTSGDMTGMKATFAPIRGLDEDLGGSSHQ